MDKECIFFYMFLVFIFFACLAIYYESDAFNLKCIVASKDGNVYCVRERNKMELAANLLATVTAKCKQLVAYLKDKHPNDPRVQRLVNGFNPKRVNETLPTSKFTAYTENKGEKMAFCLNTTKDGNKLIDEHTLTFVAFHELAHIMNESIGHKQDYWETFKFLLINAKEGKIHNPADYKNEPKEYCGMTITDDPYYDLV